VNLRVRVALFDGRQRHLGESGFERDDAIGVGARVGFARAEVAKDAHQVLAVSCTQRDCARIVAHVIAASRHAEKTAVEREHRPAHLVRLRGDVRIEQGAYDRALALQIGFLQLGVA
jgi:hypothetical protein